MGNPYCKKCKYFTTSLLNKDLGECNDPTKRVYDCNGNPVNDRPIVHHSYECQNWTKAEQGGAE